MTTASQAAQQVIVRTAVDVGIVPSTTLASQVAPGATSLPVTATTGTYLGVAGHPLFVAGGGVKWFDAAPPEPIPATHFITAVGATALTIDPAQGAPITQTHAAGALLATNVSTALPVQVGTILANDYPSVHVVILDRDDPTSASQTYWPTVVISIGYLLPVNQPEGSLMDRQVRQERQTMRCEVDMDALVAHIQTTNPVLRDPNTGISTAMAACRFIRSFRPNLQSYDVEVWEHWCDVEVQLYEVDMPNHP